MLDAKIDTLLKVSSLLNFTKAAKELSLTQPAVSHHINKLEEELNVKLFIRDKGELKLTAEGEIVVKYAMRMKSIYNKMKQDLSDENLNLTKLNIGITHTAESNFVAEVLARYSSLNTGITITILSQNTEALYNMLLNYEIDLAIVDGTVNNPNIKSLILDTDYLVLVVSNNNPLSKNNIITINDLKKEKLILRLPGSVTRNLFISHLESLNMSIDEFNVILEVDNIATIKDLIRMDFGVSILAKSTCLEDLEKGNLSALPIENLSMLMQISILYHKDFKNMDILNSIVKIYNDTAKLYK